MESEQFHMRVSPEWLAMLDGARGGETRSGFLKRLVEGALGGTSEAGPAGPVTSVSPKPVDHVTAPAFNVQRSPAERRFG